MSFDVIVVGAGNAAMAAALSAAEAGARVVVLEAAPLEHAGGNTRYAAGQLRTTFDGANDLSSLVPELTPEEAARCDFGTYGRADYLEDIGRLTGYRCDPDLAEAIVDNSLATLQWMRTIGARFQLSYRRQSVKVGDRIRFWGGLPIELWGGGAGLVEAYHSAAAKRGIEVRHEAIAHSLVLDGRRAVGVEGWWRGQPMRVTGRSVVLACGGFEANTEKRARYLGPGWDLAKVRGTAFNTGAGLDMAMAVGARPHGHWTGAHGSCWDMNAPETGDLVVGDGYQKYSYPMGITVNLDGERFFDEGADMQSYTYSRLGKAILKQPNMVAWQVFDQRHVPLLLDEYRIRRITKVRADTIEQLAEKIEGMDRVRFVETVRAFNASVAHLDGRIDLSQKDGKSTRGLPLPKSNWAQPLDQGPFEAYGVTTGITFTFGGLRISPDARVLDAALQPIPGLYAAGEIVGGIFYDGYPGGTGLVSGAVFGRRAGKGAADPLQ
jgi:tricarballylate dehydrogenase